MLLFFSLAGAVLYWHKPEHLMQFICVKVYELCQCNRLLLAEYLAVVVLVIYFIHLFSFHFILLRCYKVLSCLYMRSLFFMLFYFAIHFYICISLLQCILTWTVPPSHHLHWMGSCGSIFLPSLSLSLARSSASYVIFLLHCVLKSICVPSIKHSH